jgi:PAS domain S-box-containing protein
VIACGLLLSLSGKLPASHFFDDPVSYLPLHTALEFFSIAVALLIFAIVWHTRDKHLDGRTLFLSMTFLGVAVLDFLHAMSYTGMPALVTPSATEKAINFWLAARLLAVTGMLGAVLYTFDGLRKTAWQLALLILMSMLVGGMSWLQLFHPGMLPDTFIPGTGLTQYKINMEYFISALCLITAGLMFYRSERASNKYWLYLGAAALIMMFSEFYFTLYAKVTDIFNLLGHVTKVIAYSIVYQAVFVISVREPYQQIQRMQKAQEKTSNLLREAQKIAHLGQWELEFSTRQLSWSEGIYELFEIDARAFRASYDAFLELCHPDDRQKLDQIFNVSVRDRTPYEFVHRLLMKDGRIKWVRESGITEYDAHGQPVRSKGVVIEITNVMVMEEALRENEARWKYALAGSDQGVWDWNLLDNTIYLNSQWKLQLGYADHEVGNKFEEWSDRLHPDDKPQVMAAMNMHLRGEAPAYSAEYRLRHKNGSYIWGFDNGKIIQHSAEGLPSRIVGTLVDITRRKQAEIDADTLREQLSQSSKMESIGHLTAGIAHDFNNMLGAMMGYSELSQHMIASGKTDAVGRYQDEILKAGSRAKELIAQMLIFSRLTPGVQAPAEIPTVQLAPIVQEVVSMLRSSIPSTVELNYRIDTENLKARMQPVHLHQIILNLGINARDAMGEYGKIDISLSRQHSENQLCSSCKIIHSGDYAKITVKDSGSGINNHIQHQIFDPFFTTKGVGKGTGMGLSVVHGLVHAIGGHIQVESNEVNGTSFSILLPLATSDSSSIESVGDAPVCDIKDARIMVVDDEQAMLNMLSEFLAMQGAQVLAYASPILALEAYTLNPESIDLLITDETMPGLSGMHLAENLLRLNPALPVILCTGYSEHATAELAAKSGIAGFFYKPLKMKEILLSVQALLAVKNGLN